LVQIDVPGKPRPSRAVLWYGPLLLPTWVKLKRVPPPTLMPRLRETPRYNEAASNARATLCETVTHWRYTLSTMNKNWCKPGDYERLEQAVKETQDWIYSNFSKATKDEFEAKTRKLMKVGESVLDFYGPPQPPLTDAEKADFWARMGEISRASFTASTQTLV